MKRTRPRVLFQHYCELARPDEEEAYFSITPATVAPSKHHSHHGGRMTAKKAIKSAKKSAKKKAGYPLLAPPEFIPPEMPTATELATLAIPLIKGNKQDPKEYIGAVISAMWLWDEAYRRLPEIRQRLYSRHAIAELSAELPHLVHEWPKDDEGDKLIVPYEEGIASMFPHDKKDRRDGLMRELLEYNAKDCPREKKIGHKNWQRLKAKGFTSNDFLWISYSLAEWRKQRKSEACRENANKRIVKKTKKSFGGGTTDNG